MPEPTGNRMLMWSGAPWALAMNAVSAGGIKVAGAPWWFVTVLFIAGTVAAAVIRLIHEVMPQDSADRRAVLLAVISRVRTLSKAKT